jgi:hypothetical protein
MDLVRSPPLLNGTSGAEMMFAVDSALSRNTLCCFALLSPVFDAPHDVYLLQKTMTFYYFFFK